LGVIINGQPFVAATQDPAAANLSVTEITFLRGKEFYEKGEFSDALKYFNTVLALDNAHALAREYAELAQQQLDLLNEPSYKEWRVSFDARQFDKAAAAYAKIRSAVADETPGAAQLTAQIEAQYQKVLSNLVNTWKAACAASDLQRSDSIRYEAANVASGLSFTRDALAQMQQCAAPRLDSTAPTRSSVQNSASPSRTTPAKPPKPANGATTAPEPTACIRRDPMLVMKELQFRANPLIEPNLQRYVGRGIVVSIEIDDKGTVAVKRVAKANPRIADALKFAVEEWKFNPIVVDDQPRCVYTDLPIGLIQP